MTSAHLFGESTLVLGNAGLLQPLYSAMPPDSRLLQVLVAGRMLQAPHQRSGGSPGG